MSGTQKRHLKETPPPAGISRTANLRPTCTRMKSEPLNACGLAPVTLSPLPAAPAVNPATSHPGVSSARWTLPASGSPGIASAFPALVTRNPDETDSRSGRRSFHYQRRGRCAHVNAAPDSPATTREQQHDPQCESKKKARTPGHQVLQSPPCGAVRIGGPQR